MAVDTMETYDEHVEPQHVEPNWHVELPHPSDGVAIQEFLGEIDRHAGTRGVKTLKEYFNKYLRTVKIAEDHYSKAQTAANTINGVVSARSIAADPNRKLRRSSKKFYEALSTPMLRKQCELFEVDYNAFDSQEDIIKALVDKNVEMAR